MLIDSGQKIFLVPVSLMAFEGQEMSPRGGTSSLVLPGGPVTP